MICGAYCFHPLRCLTGFVGVYIHIAFFHARDTERTWSERTDGDLIRVPFVAGASAEGVVLWQGEWIFHAPWQWVNYTAAHTHSIKDYITPPVAVVNGARTGGESGRLRCQECCLERHLHLANENWLIAWIWSENLFGDYYSPNIVLVILLGTEDAQASSTGQLPRDGVKGGAEHSKESLYCSP